MLPQKFSAATTRSLPDGELGELAVWAQAATSSEIVPERATSAPDLIVLESTPRSAGARRPGRNLQLTERTLSQE